MNKIIKLSVVSFVLFMTFFTKAYSQTSTGMTPLQTILSKYCVPKTEVGCSSSSRASYTSSGCSCPAGKQYNKVERKCEPCPAGSFKTTAGVGDCISITCGAGTYLIEVPSCGVSEYREVIK